jgi:hypothetical protein
MISGESAYLCVHEGQGDLVGIQRRATAEPGAGLQIIGALDRHVRNQNRVPRTDGRRRDHPTRRPTNLAYEWLARDLHALGG